MPLKLLSPRKTGRQFWYLRGVHCGKRHFFSTKCKDDPRKENPHYIRDAEKAIERQQQGRGRITFAAAAQNYIDYRKPSARDEAWIDRLIEMIGEKFVDEINQNDLVQAANDFYPSAAPATKNRAIIRPAAAILHYAADNRWCHWLRVKIFKEPTPKTRYVTPEVERKLHDGLRKNGTRWRVQKRLLLLWMFRQGDRISDILRARYEDCDFDRRTVRRHISKNDTYTTLPLDETICRYLRKRGETEGFIFLWRSRWGAERWLLNLTRRLGVDFTPHRASHTVGKRLSDSGASLRTIMDKLGHADHKSSMRYQRGDIETIRRASEVLK